MFWKKYIEFQFVRNRISLSFVWIACLSPHTFPFTSLLRKSEIRERFHWIWDGTTLHTRWHSENLEALTLAAPWWEGCAAPSPGWPPSAPPLEQPAPAEPSQPPRCQPGRDQAQSGNCGIVELVWNALSIIGSIYIPQNMVCTYIFKLLECAKVSVWNLRDLHLQSIWTEQQTIILRYLQFSLKLNNLLLLLIQRLLKAFNLALGVRQLLLQVVHLVGRAQLTRRRFLAGTSCSHVRLVQVHLGLGAQVKIKQGGKVKAL